jgi:hypothetical protein
MARYYLISKLDEKKALKLTYNNNKKDIIFRDYANKLFEIDHDKYARLLEIIGTDQAKVAAVWIKLAKKYKKDGCFGIIKSNPILDEIIKNAKAYIKDNYVVIKYENAPVAEFIFPLDTTTTLGNNNEIKFQDAIDLLIKHKKQKLNENESYPIITFNCAEAYDVNLDFSGLYKYGFTSKKNSYKPISLSNFIKEIDVDKINEFIYTITKDDTIKFDGNVKAVMFLDKALSQIDFSKVENKYIRKLIRLKQKYDIFTALLIVNKFTSGFGVRIYSDLDMDFPKHLFLLNRKIKLKKDIIYLNKIKLNGIEKDGFYIYPDGTVKIMEYKTAKYYFDMSFIIHYTW